MVVKARSAVLIMRAPLEADPVCLERGQSGVIHWFRCTNATGTKDSPLAPLAPIMNLAEDVPQPAGADGMGSSERG